MSGPAASAASRSASISRRCRLGQARDGAVERGEAVVGVDAELAEGGGVLVEDVGEEHFHDVAEDDRVGDLHHGGLQMHGEQHALTLGVRDLLGHERAQRGAAHDGGIDHRAGVERQPILENSGAAARLDQLDTGLARVGRGDGAGHLGAPQVARAHGRHVGLRVGAPCSHGVRVLAGVGLHRGGGAPVGVALPQHRVDGAAFDAVVPLARVALGVGGGLVGVVGQCVAPGLELRDGRLELRQRGADVGELDDVRHRRLRQPAQVGQSVVDALLLAQSLGEGGQHAAG